MAYRRGESDMEKKGWSQHPPGPEPLVLGEATHRYPDWDRATVFDALTTHRRRWIHLHPGEVLPSVMWSERPSRVVWSSFWPAAPDDTSELLLEESRPGTTAVRWIWRSPTPPDDRGVGITRQRLNTKLGADIRGWFAHLVWSDSQDEPTAE